MEHHSRETSGSSFLWKRRSRHIASVGMLFSLCTGFAIAQGAQAEIRDWHGTSFEAYLQEFGKAAYGRAERDDRRRIFEAKLQEVVAHNAQYLAGEHTWSKSLNEFSDFTTEEFTSMLK